MPRLDGPSQVFHAGAGYLSPGVQAMIRIPAGHPEGYLEAFANLYREFADAVSGTPGLPSLVPGIDAGVRGMALVAQAVDSSRSRAWCALKDI